MGLVWGGEMKSISRMEWNGIGQSVRNKSNQASRIALINILKIYSFLFFSPNIYTTT